MDIDIPTLSLVIVIINILQAFAISFLYVSNRNYRGIGWWMLGTTLNAAGFFFLLLREILPAIITIILANSLIISGSIFIYIGIMRFLEKKEKLILILPVFVLFIILYIYYTYAVNDITVRTAVLSVFHAYYLFLTVSALLGQKPGSINDSAHFIACVEFFLACFSLFRAVYVLLFLPVTTIFTSNFIQNASFLFFLAGGFLLTLGLIFMVNQRLNAEVVEAKEHFELIFNTSPDGILVLCYDNGAIVDINEGFTNLTGFSAEDTIGLSCSDIHLWKDPGKIKLILDEIKTKGFCENSETVLQRKDESEITGILSARIITLHDVPHILCVTRDITGRKLAEEAFQQANSKLNLLSSITRHDILNSLTVLMGYLDLASEEPAGAKLKGYLQKMDESTKKIRHQIEFTREYQEIGVNAAAWQNIREIIRENSLLFRMDNIALNIKCADIEIFADPLLKKVFYNLFDNAFRYAGPITAITVSCIEREEGLSVVFADDGEGIAEDIKKHLFVKGFGKHTGLGLFLSKEILAITGITITENGQPGKGARFEMAVPKGAYKLSAALEKQP